MLNKVVQDTHVFKAYNCNEYSLVYLYKDIYRDILATRVV